MDTFVFMVTVHGEGGHVATYEVHAGGATDAIEMAANAYRGLIMGTVKVCEVRLSSTETSLLRALSPASDEPVTVKDQLPGYTWAQQHGFSVEAWRLTLNAMGRAYAEPGIYLSHIRQWFNWPNEIIDEVGNYITEYNN